ncbi:uncharacterized protein [Magallana gigas]|uniref:uncharacterized protein n=1 Tax=Magallana gigas TaxID=29159 RepID=UPI00333EECD8
MLSILLVLVSIVQTTVSTTTHHPHHGINEGLSFHYDAETHIMALKTHGHCYLYVLTAHQQHSVHTSMGLHAIEKTMIDLVDSHGSFVHFSAQELSLLSHGLGHFCAHATVLRIN